MPFDIGQQRKISYVSVILLRAAGLIAEPQAWCAGRDVRRRWFGPPQYCVVGAVRWALDNYRVQGLDEDDVVGWLDKAAERRGFADIVSLNDHPDTTHALVLQTIAEAADLAMVEYDAD